MQAVALTSGQLVLLALTYALVGVVGVFVGALLMGKPRGTKRDQPDLRAMSDALHALQQEMQAIKGSLDRSAAPKPEPVESAYSQAIKLAQQGLDSAAVAAGCGISRGEADLIVAIYRASQRP